MGRVAGMRRWLPFAAAALATVLLAGGFGLAVDRLATPGAPAAPQLKTVSAATLTRLGVTLEVPAQPVYCRVAGVAIASGWLRSGSAGCAISKSAAEAAAGQGGGARVIESVLATVSSSRVSTLGHDLLAWVVVAQQTQAVCQQGAGGRSLCLGGRGGLSWTQLVVVDAHSGGVVNRLRVTPAGGGRVQTGAGRLRPGGFPAGAAFGAG